MDKSAYDHIFVESHISYQTQLRNTLKNVIEGVYGDLMGNIKILPNGVIIKGWVDTEADANRFRITENNFEEALRYSIHENINAKSIEFPDSAIFLNR